MSARASALLVALALSACATCRQHPVACTVAAAVVAGGIAAAAEHRADRQPYTKDWNKLGTAFGPQY